MLCKHQIDGVFVLILIKLQAIMMSIVPPIALTAVFYGRFVSKISRKTTHATAELTKFSEGTVTLDF